MLFTPTRRRPRVGKVASFALGLWSSACLPFGGVLEGEDEDPYQPCFYSEEHGGPSARFSGTAHAAEPGQIAPAELTVSLDEALSEKSASIALTVQVRAGQSISGHPLQISLADTVLQETTFGGALGNEASFALTLAAERCATPCTLSLRITAPDAQSPVPVPLELEGTVAVKLEPLARKCSKSPPRAVVANLGEGDHAS